MPGREEIDVDMGTYSDDLPGDDLLEDGELDVEVLLKVGPISPDGTARKGDHNNDPKASTRSEHLGRSIQRRPPRPTHSASGGRKPTVQAGGRRTTRRVAAAEKHWGNASMPSITVRDIMGSEKKATAVGMVGSDHSRPNGSPTKDSTSGAEQKRSMIRSRWNEKRNRQSNVKNSLAQFLSEDQSGESAGEIEDAEDEEIISEDDELFRHASTQSLHLDFGADDDSDDARSVKSSKSQSRSHRRRRTVTKRTDGNSTDGDIPGSAQSGSRGSRRRHRKSDGADDDDKSVGSTRSRSKSRRPASRRSSSRHGRDEIVAATESSVNEEQMRRGRISDEGQKKSRSSSTKRAAPSKSRSTRKKSSGDDDDRSVGSRKAVGTRRRKTTDGDDDDRSVGSRKTGAVRRRKTPVDDDDRSVGSRKSVGGRRRRQQSQRTKKPSSASHEDAPDSSRPRSARVEAGSPPVSPLGSKPNSASSVVEMTDKLASLSHHIEANPLLKSATDLEERSEESSRFSASYEQPQSLLQFDPTNANNITMVSQDKANVTSERFRRADGTESELHITELAGLPTFEAPQSNLNESQNSDMLEADRLHQSARSLGSIEHASDGDAPKAAKSMSHIGYKPKRSETAQKAGQKSQEGGRGASPGNSAGRIRGVTGSRSFLARRRKPENDEKPPRSASHDNTGTFHESMKGFFGAWNKKGEGESEGEDDDQPKGNRFFRKREGVEHQALDDDGSDEN